MFCPRCQATYPGEWKVCPTDTTPLLKSARIGKYTVEGVLGVGGMGAVFRAKNPDTGAAVAIKVMMPESATSTAARERFRREAGVVTRLDTAHVCKVYDFGEDDGMMYLVMEMMKGHTLADEVSPAPGYMDLARVQMVMNGALKGLIAAHSNGIVHRDLKPENIFVADTFDGEVPKLLDFGIARVASPGEAALTRTGALMGTASYMAPEQVAGANVRIGPATDVYAMGAILYELLAGAPAFGGETITDVFARVVKGDLVPLPAIRPGLPVEIYDLIKKCLAIEPTDRPADAEAMRALLLSAGLVPAGTVVPPPAKTRDDPRKPPPSIAVAETDPPSRKPSAAPFESTLTAEGTAKPKGKGAWIALGAVVVAGAAVAIVVVTSSKKKEVAAVAPPPPPVVAPKPVAVVPLDAPAHPSPHPDMVLIPAGDYEIGEQQPLSDTGLTAATYQIGAFWIDKTEVTRGQLEAALGDDVNKATREKTKGDAPTTPARFVDFAEADHACVVMGKRMPTEFEWEVAARTTPQDASRAKLRRTGEEADLLATGTDCSAAGLCDMLGSLIEWTSDDFPKQPEKSKVVRGGSYRTPPADVMLSSIHARTAAQAAVMDRDIGFRCALDPTAEEQATR